MLAGKRDYGGHGLRRLNRPAAEVVRVLHGDRRRRHQVRTGCRCDQLGDRVRIQPSPVRAPGPEGDAGEHRRNAGLRAGDMGQRVADELLARPHEALDAELVAERARRDEQPRREPQQRRNLRLERVDGRVLAVDIIADLSLGHRDPHAGARPGDCVAAEVDYRGAHTPRRRRSATSRSATRKASSSDCSMFSRGSQAVS